MRKNLETLEILGRKTARFGVDSLGVIAGSLIFPSYCRTNCDKIGKDLIDSNERYQTLEGMSVPEADHYKLLSDLALMLGVAVSCASLISQLGYVNNRIDIPETAAYIGSLILGTNTLSGLHEWFRATKKGKF